MSLVELAEYNQLPDHQYIDRETLNWIIQNKPSFDKPISYKVKDVTPEYFKKFIPPNNWFLVPIQVNSIHGVRHLLRVAIYTAQLCDIKKRTNLIISALLHDIRQLNDKGDTGHGQRAADWFKDNFLKVQRYFKIRFSKRDIEEIYYSIYYHEIPYKDILADTNYKKYKEAVDILKTADALDRYRQPKIKWWIDDSYLVLVPDEKLKKFAYDLVIITEAMHLDGYDNARSILEGLKIQNYKL